MVVDLVSCVRNAEQAVVTAMIYRECGSSQGSRCRDNEALRMMTIEAIPLGPVPYFWYSAVKFHI